MDIRGWVSGAPGVWELAREGAMRVPGRLYASESLVREMDDQVAEQLRKVATLPGIVGAACAMPDAHSGYGFPIGGVAAFDADEGGVVSAGGVGFDISCGVRCLLTGLTRERLMPLQGRLADRLFERIPAGVGSTGRVRLNAAEMDDMLVGGAAWAVEQGFGVEADLDRIEEGGHMLHARPTFVSVQAKRRQREQMGTLGSGNHYVEVQTVAETFDEAAAAAYGLKTGDVVVMIHSGSRGLGHQIGSEFLLRMAAAAPGFGLVLPDRELACAPIHSELGQEYLGAMRAAINCAFANRQILTHLVRQVFAELLPTAHLPLLYDVSHNSCKVETHQVDGRARRLHVHRKGATRAFGRGHDDLPDALRATGQPVLIGGSMGTGSYVMAGNSMPQPLAFASACHGAGRAMSRQRAQQTWHGDTVIAELASRGIVVRSPSPRGVAAEAPHAYKDVAAVVSAAEAAGLARRVVRTVPLLCVKG